MPLAKKSIAPTSSGSSLARLSQGFAEVTEAAAVAVLAAAPAGTLFCPGPAFYMDKFIVPPAARDAVDPSAPVASSA